jgi:hypothetical protein
MSYDPDLYKNYSQYWTYCFYKGFKTADLDCPWFSQLSDRTTWYKYGGLQVNEEYYFSIPENRKKLLIELIKAL